MTLEDRKISDLVPYWRNPRRISEEAVNAVAESIRQYGYRQPIVVDEKNVIIIGHTRYAALRRLGFDTVPVRVARDLSPKQVRELRAIDNRVSEFTSWDFDALVDEIEGMDEGLRAQFFPELVEDAGEESTGVDPSAWAAEATEEAGGNAEFVCPSCFHMWEMTVTEKMIRNGEIGEHA